jgi:branched-chain amino acid transport system ATP-binding protein
VLAVADLHVRYGSITAVRGASLRVSAGELVALVGANGAGKSSLLLAIAGGLRGVTGSIELGGEQLLGRGP